MTTARPSRARSPCRVSRQSAASRCGRRPPRPAAKRCSRQGRQEAKPPRRSTASPGPRRPCDPDAAIRIAQTGGKDLTIDPHGMLLFSNTQKDAENPTRPDYWGYYNPGGGERLMRLAVWARTDSRGNAMLTGNIQRDEPRAKDVAPSKTKAKAKTREMEPSL